MRAVARDVLNLEIRQCGCPISFIQRSDLFVDVHSSKNQKLPPPRHAQIPGRAGAVALVRLAVGLVQVRLLGTYHQMGNGQVQTDPDQARPGRPEQGISDHQRAIVHDLWIAGVAIRACMLQACGFLSHRLAPPQALHSNGYEGHAEVHTKDGEDEERAGPVDVRQVCCYPSSMLQFGSENERRWPNASNSAEV
jgi:hypothetical protein